MNRNFLLKRYNLLQLQSFIYTPPSLLLANASKIIRNWFLTLQLDNYLKLSKLAQERACMEYEHLTLYNVFVYAPIYVLTYLCTCVKERKASLKFLH